MNNIFSPMINKLSLVRINSLIRFLSLIRRNINVIAIKLSNILAQSEYLNKYD